MIASLVSYVCFFLTLTLILGVAALGLNAQWGGAGLFNVGVAGFVLVGAYVSALLTAAPSPQHCCGWQLPIPIGWLAAMLAAGLVALAVGLVTLRLRADYLAITTFGAAASLQLVALNAQSITGGPFGVALIPRPFEALADRALPFGLANLALVAAIAAACFIGLERLARGPWGRVLRAIRDDEAAAASLGKWPDAFRMQAFVIGAALMGLAGAMQAQFFGFIAPDNYLPALTFQIWVMLVVGGSGNNRGALLGAVVVWGLWTFSGAALAAILPPDWQARAASLRVAAIGVALAAALLLRPRGLLGETAAISRHLPATPPTPAIIDPGRDEKGARMSEATLTRGPRHIVVVGGGAAGLELVTKLGDTLGKRRQARITLVERSRTHLWKPLLHSVAAGSLRRSQHELNYLAQAHWHHFTYRYGEMIGLDRAGKQVLLAAMRDEEGREITPPTSLAYDTLILAIGSVTNDFGTPGAKQFAVPLETPEQASRFNRRLVNACLRANAQAEPVRPGQLHIAIIGAGATGTELAAELHRTVRAVVAYGMDRIDPARDVHIVLIEAAERILPVLPERISNATRELLESLGVEVRTRARVSEVRADGVVLASGEFIPSELVVWSAGVKAPDFLQGIDGLETTRINQLIVTETLQTTRDPDIFAIGDCCSCPRAGEAAPVPPRAQAAHQMASHMVRQVSRLLAGQPLAPFRYRDFGSLVSLGKYSTVGSLMGFVVGRSMFIEGLFARIMYRSLYKMHEAALHGGRTVLWRTVVSTISQRPTPGVKLH